MARARTEIMHFSVQGEDLTRIVRDTMLSDLPKTAYQILKESLRGPKGHIEHYAPKILNGDMKLVGDESGMDCVSDKGSKGYKKSLHWGTSSPCGCRS
jgi:hypothetical protein